MILSYSLRLLSLCFASFFLVHAAARMAVWVAERPAVRFAERIKARSAARLLFWIRILPAGIAIVFVLGVCTPSYVRFEPDMAREEVGFACLAMAFLGALICAVAAGRGIRAAIHSTRFAHRCRRCGSVVHLAGKPSEMFVIQGPRPFLVQSGVFRPHFAISQRLLNEFSDAELDAALGHERAHWLSRDNLKRLLVVFLPDIVPFWKTFDPLERAWAKFAERAADDVVSGEGAGFALSLAAALVRLARMRGTMEPPSWALRVASSLGGSDDLRGRVERLLAPTRCVGAEPAGHGRIFWGIASFLTVSCLAALASPMLQAAAHQLLERLLR
jgi:hypothetical protein